MKLLPLKYVFMQELLECTTPQSNQTPLLDSSRFNYSHAEGPRKKSYNLNWLTGFPATSLNGSLAAEDYYRSY